MLTSTVQVIGKQRIPTKSGAVEEGAGIVVTDLLASIQHRATLGRKAVLGFLPQMTHMMYCRAEDSAGNILDIHLGDDVNELNGQLRKFKVLTQPEVYPDIVSGGNHHLEMELQELVYERG